MIRLMKMILLLVSLLISTSVLAKEFSGVMVVEVMGIKRGKIYYKNKDIFRTDMMGMIQITNGDQVYILGKETKKYTVTDREEMLKDNPSSAFQNIEELLEQGGLSEIGKEEVAGYKCVIYEGEAEISADYPEVPVKIWYSKELGSVLRSEVEAGAPVGKIISYIEAISEGNLDSKLFEIPPDYEEAADLVEIMGMPNLNIDQFEEGDTPNEEQLEQMMEQMQQMMEQMGGEQ